MNRFLTYVWILLLSVLLTSVSKAQVFDIGSEAGQCITSITTYAVKIEDGIAEVQEKLVDNRLISGVQSGIDEFKKYKETFNKLKGQATDVVSDAKSSVSNAQSMAKSFKEKGEATEKVAQAGKQIKEAEQKAEQKKAELEASKKTELAQIEEQQQKLRTNVSATQQLLDLAKANQNEAGALTHQAHIDSMNKEIAQLDTQALEVEKKYKEELEQLTQESQEQVKELQDSLDEAQKMLKDITSAINEQKGPGQEEVANSLLGAKGAAQTTEHMEQLQARNKGANIKAVAGALSVAIFSKANLTKEMQEAEDVYQAANSSLDTQQGARSANTDQKIQKLKMMVSVLEQLAQSIKMQGQSAMAMSTQTEVLSDGNYGTLNLCKYVYQEEGATNEKK